MNLKKNTDFNKEHFEVEFTEQYIEELQEIYDYIANKLKENIAAQKLINKVNQRVLNLENSPELYMKIGKTDKLKRDYHRMVINNYIVLYTIDHENRKVYVSRIVYGRRNYLS